MPKGFLWRRRSPITLQCSSSLEAAHRAGIIHRDIKPENIMLRPDGVAKVVDFGLARMLEPRAESMLEATQTGSVMGTPRYMSPEQARGDKLDVRSDIFSLGAVLFEMACGSPGSGRQHRRGFCGAARCTAGHRRCRSLARRPLGCPAKGRRGSLFIHGRIRRRHSAGRSQPQHGTACGSGVNRGPPAALARQMGRFGSSRRWTGHLCLESALQHSSRPGCRASDHVRRPKELSGSRFRRQSHCLLLATSLRGCPAYLCQACRKRRTPAAYLRDAGGCAAVLVARWQPDRFLSPGSGPDRIRFALSGPLRGLRRAPERRRRTLCRAWLGRSFVVR